MKANDYIAFFERDIEAGLTPGNAVHNILSDLYADALKLAHARSKTPHDGVVRGALKEANDKWLKIAKVLQLDPTEFQTYCDYLEYRTGRIQ